MSENKVITFLFIITTLLSCRNHNTTTVEKYVQDINNLPISKSLYVFEIDSNRIIIDTLIIRDLKYDLNKNLLFESNFQIKSGLKTINYYDTINGMVYSEVKSNDEIISDFTTIIDDKLIKSASYNIYEDSNKINSVVMNYYYTFNNDKKIKLLIDSGDGFSTTEYYNSSEKPVLNITLSRNDTIEKTEFIYNENNILRKKTFKNFSKNEKIIYKYNDYNEIVEELFYSNQNIETSTYYYKDKNGNYLIYKKLH